MQVGIVNQLPNGTEITARVAEVLRAAREVGFPVFFSRHMSLPKELMGVFQLRQAMTWQRTDRVEEVEPWFPRDSPQFQIVPELEPLPNETVSDKIAMSAFSGTFLDMALRDLEIDPFAICGIELRRSASSRRRATARISAISPSSWRTRAGQVTRRRRGARSRA